MVRGPRKHLKRLAAPKSWLLDLKKGVFAPRPSTGPHSLEESIPLSLLISDKLEYARTGKEVVHILKNKMILINGRVRKDKRFPVGLFDVLSIPKSNEHYRILYNTAGRFILHPISEEESKFRLGIVSKKQILKKNIPVVYTKDGSSFRFSDREIVKGDTVKIDLETSRIIDFIHLGVGKLAFVSKGKNMGCVGVVTHIEEKGHSEPIIKLKDKNNRTFATQKSNLLVIGKEDTSIISLPEGEGLKLSIFDQSNLKYEGKLVSLEEEH